MNKEMELEGGRYKGLTVFPIQRVTSALDFDLDLQHASWR